MLNLVCKEGMDLKEWEEKYILMLPDGTAYEADDYRECVAGICGRQYLDCECAETEWHERTHAAKRIGLAEIAAREIESGLWDETEDMDEDEEDAYIKEKIGEPIIMYDERIGKIPYSYTDPVVDYDIHGTPDLIRVESDLLFLFSLLKLDMIGILEKTGDTIYAQLGELIDIDATMAEEIRIFANLDVERVPLHKKIGE